MKNQLSKSNSPYLLQHADNPVHWQPWSEQALADAKREHKPIFLSIGYAACHWCHVMAHESFEDQETADYLNEHFINIKVDREERPDLDAIYMKAVVAMTGQGGWPMSVFLTPEGKPFYGGTYFPPQPRHQLPAFRQVLETVVKIWKEDPQRLITSGEQITAHLQSDPLQEQAELSLDEGDLDGFVRELYKGYDWQNGGWGRAPKFPQGMAISYLLSQSTRGNTKAENIALHALDAMSTGGMYDWVGGGFSRYSVDDTWLVPHFEKMLYDNALLARSYLQAYLITGKESYRKITENTLDFVIRELRDEQGGFYSSLDADSEGSEGTFYIWSLEEIETALEDESLFDLFRETFSATRAGNFEGKNVLQLSSTVGSLAEVREISLEELQADLGEIRKKLFRDREKRPRPAVDDKVILSWNGLMLTAFAEAGRYLNRDDYTQIAAENADFLLTNLANPQGRLLRSWRQGQADHLAFLEDYASLILGLLALYQTDFQNRWYAAARQITGQMMELFFDPQQGFYDTGTDHESLIYRPLETQDNALPSGSSLAAAALLLISAYTMNFDWQEIAEILIQKQKPQLELAPIGFGQWLSAADLLVGPLNEIALIGPVDELQEHLTRIWSTYRPRTITAQTDSKAGEDQPEILEDRPQVNQLPTAYLCRNYVCLEPVNQPQKLIQQLEADG